MQFFFLLFQSKSSFFVLKINRTHKFSFSLKADVLLHRSRGYWYNRDYSEFKMG
jgi:hypothetical protein